MCTIIGTCTIRKCFVKLTQTQKHILYPFPAKLLSLKSKLILYMFTPLYFVCKIPLLAHALGRQAKHARDDRVSCNIQPFNAPLLVYAEVIQPVF